MFVLLRETLFSLSTIQLKLSLSKFFSAVRKMHSPVLMSRQSSLIVPRVSITSSTKTYSRQSSNNDDSDDTSVCSTGSSKRHSEELNEFAMPDALLPLRQLPAVADVCETDREDMLDNIFYWRIRAYQARPETRQWRLHESDTMCQQTATKIVQLIGQVRAGSSCVAHDVLCTDFSTNKSRRTSRTVDEAQKNTFESGIMVNKRFAKLEKPQGPAAAGLMTYQVQDWLMELLTLLPVWVALQMQRGALDYEVEQDNDVALVARLHKALREIEAAACQELTRLRAHDEMRQKAIQRSLGFSVGHAGLQHRKSHRLSGVLLEASLLAYRPDIRHRRRRHRRDDSLNKRSNCARLLRYSVQQWPVLVKFYGTVLSQYCVQQHIVLAVNGFCRTHNGRIKRLRQWPSSAIEWFPKSALRIYKYMPPMYWKGLAVVGCAGVGFLLGIVTWPL